MSEILEIAEKIKATGESAPRLARDPVNRPMINNWTEAIGDANPLYAAEGLAPPAMIQVWTMGGLHGHRTPDDPFGSILAAFDDAGYTSIVATNCEQTYHRYVREGEHLTVAARLDVQAKRNLVITFGGGVNEVQRELIAQFGLKLPRVPR